MSSTGHASERVIGWALRFRALVLALGLALAVFGVVRLPTTSVAALPEFAPPTVEVQTEALGLSAAEVEQLITVPLEADLLNGVAYLDEIRSESIAGLSSIEMVFEPGTDILDARQVVAERLTQAHALPNVSKPPAMLQPLSSTSRVMMISLSSDELSAIEVSVLARWKIRPYLMGVPGVANVSIWGQRERQLQVQVDPQRLHDNGVTLAQVVETTGNALWVSPLSFVEASTPGTGGFIDTPNQRLTVQHISPIRQASDLAGVTLEDTGGRFLTLGQVASVVEDHQPLIGDAMDDGSPALILVIERFPDVSTVEVTEGVEDAMEDLTPALPDVAIDTNVYRPASYVESGLENLQWMFLVGLLLMIAVVGIVLRSLIVAVLTVVSIAASLGIALLVLSLFDVTLNSMTLAGLVIALAAVVDDGIVSFGAVRRRAQVTSETSDARRDAVLAALSQARRPLGPSTVILLIAAVPLTQLPGLANEFARPLVVAYALAITASLLTSLTLLPVLASLLPASSDRDWSVTTAFRTRYRNVLSWFADRAALVYATAAVGIVLAAGAIPLSNDREILPTFREPTLIIEWNGPAGTSHPEMARIVSRASTEISELDGVAAVGGQVGRAITSDQVVSVSSSELWVSVDEDADYEGTIAAVDTVLDGYPGLFHESRTYPEEQVSEARIGTAGDVVVRVYGQDLPTLEAKAEELRTALAEVDGLGDPHVDYDPVEPTIEIQVDLAAAEDLGIKPGDVRRAAAVLLSGIEVGSLFEQQKIFEVVVWGDPAVRHSITSVEDLLIDRPGGGQVRLGDVADVRIAARPNVIKRESVSRRVDVVAELDGRSLDDVRGDVEAAIDAVEFPIEYHAVILDRDGSSSSDREFLALALAAILLGFLIFQVLFGSWRLAALATAIVPAAVAGGALAAGLLDGPLTLAAGAGLLAVVGFVVRHTAGLVTEVRTRSSSGERARDAVARAADDRLVPLLASALATSALLLPAIAVAERPGLEVVRDIAVVIVCGLVTSVLCVAFLLPALCLRLEGAFSAEDTDDRASDERTRQS